MSSIFLHIDDIYCILMLPQQYFAVFFYFLSPSTFAPQLFKLFLQWIQSVSEGFKINQPWCHEQDGGSCAVQRLAQLSEFHSPPELPCDPNVWGWLQVSLTCTLSQENRTWPWERVCVRGWGGACVRVLSCMISAGVGLSLGQENMAKQRWVDERDAHFPRFLLR